MVAKNKVAKMSEVVFESSLVREYTFGLAKVHYTDIGHVRKAFLSYNDIQVMSWQSNKEEKWLASALCHFVEELGKGHRRPAKEEHQLYGCIAKTMQQPNTGRRWQEDAFKGSIRKAVLICQSITGLAFPIENYVPDLSLPAAKKLLASITKAQ